MTETNTRTARAHLAPGLKSKKSSVMTEIDRKPAAMIRDHRAYLFPCYVLARTAGGEHAIFSARAAS